MDTTAHSDFAEPSPPAPVAVRVTLVALLALGVLFIAQQVLIFQALTPPVGIVQAAGSLVVAAIVASGRRWSPALAAAWCALLIAGSFPMIVGDLGDPGDVADFVFTLVVVPVVLIGVAAGTWAAVASYRSSRR